MKKLSNERIKELVGEAMALVPGRRWDDPMEYKTLTATLYAPMAAEIFRVLVEQERGTAVEIRVGGKDAGMGKQPFPSR